ncbi:YfiR family protein [Denitromonas iodatirespirans]|uniref:YfiR family protein n=1 Tax=Denitromonas iodatirespirans TaxID=2795389 RepID=A0A944D8J0_DENI1|nr:YfiR family protein [Denitromonas iodatirespirans]MBT0962070.1 YfiR family protein [Denitromonas iodatirespirans]
MSGGFWRRAAPLLLAAVLAQPAGAAPPTEYQLKAVFLLNFARYVTWPEGAMADGDAIDICVLGRDPFGAHLTGLEARQAQGHNVKVHAVSSPESAERCEVVFVSASEQRRLNVILRDLAPWPVLTVSDIDGFVEAGGMIGLVTEDDRIRFDINRSAVATQNLRLSAQLLKLARRLLGQEGS